MKKLKRKNKTYLFALTAFLSTVILFSFSFQDSNKANAADIIVYKSPTCGCCNKWVKHLETSGFNVKTINKRNMNPVKMQFGVKTKYQSCHTAKIGIYFIEGHVPASDIKKMLAEKPDAKGLAVPGMPMGSPGMEGHRKDKYSVLLIDDHNNAKVYSQH